MKEAVTKIIDTLTQEDFYGAFQKLLERYKCIAVGGDYIDGETRVSCKRKVNRSRRPREGSLSNSYDTEV